MRRALLWLLAVLLLAGCAVSAAVQEEDDAIKAQLLMDAMNEVGVCRPRTGGGRMGARPDGAQRRDAIRRDDGQPARKVCEKPGEERAELGDGPVQPLGERVHGGAGKGAGAGPSGLYVVG